MKQNLIADFEAPYEVRIAKRRGIFKAIKVNTNIIQSLNRFDYSKAKKAYKRQIERLNLKFKAIGKIEIEYHVYHNKGIHDLSNISPVEKFLEDALSELGLIEDDCTRFIPKTSRIYAGYSKKVKVQVKIKQFI